MVVVEKNTSWVIVHVFPATVIVPERAAPLFAATSYCTVALPLPLKAEVIVIQLSDFAAVQGQALPEAVMLMAPLPPAAAKFFCSGAIVKLHGVTVMATAAVRQPPLL